MTYILIEWVTEKKRDVYSTRSIVEASIGYRLMTDERAVDELRGPIVNVQWTKGMDPAPAFLLDIGKQRKVLERKRLRFVEDAQKNDPESQVNDAAEPAHCSSDPPSAESTVDTVERLRTENELLQIENNALKRQLASMENFRESSKLVKRLKVILEKAEKEAAAKEGLQEEAVAQPHPVVDIGGGVTVEEGALERLRCACPGSASKFARGLLRLVFSKDELQGKSLYGRQCNVRKDLEPKEALDPARLNAVLGFTAKEVKGCDTARLKTSIATMLARELK